MGAESRRPLAVTPARLLVLRAVADTGFGVRCTRSNRNSAQRVSWLYARGRGSSRKNVSGRCDEMERAGWIQMDDPDEPIRIGDHRRWRLTDLGRKVLEDGDAL